MDSTPDEVSGFFNLPNPSSHTVALGSTQPLTETSRFQTKQHRSKNHKPKFEMVQIYVQALTGK
jgi:hypothetical protein